MVCRSPGERGFCCGDCNARNIRLLSGSSPAVQKTRRGSARQKRSRILAALSPSLGGTVASPAARRQQRRNRSKNQIRASDIFQAAPRRLAQCFSAERLRDRLWHSRAKIGAMLTIRDRIRELIADEIHNVAGGILEDGVGPTPLAGLLSSHTSSLPQNS